jgi:hypothetical protein
LAIVAGCSRTSVPAVQAHVQDHPDLVSLHAVDASARWNVEVLVVNTAHSSRTLHVTLNRDSAVDATFPAIQLGPPQDSPWPPYRFNVPADRIRIHATSSGGGTGTATARRGSGHRLWVLVTDYDPLRLGIEVKAYRHRPLFG